MTGNLHRIHRQVLELELATAAGAARLQEEAARPFRAGELPGVEALFDRMAGPRKTLRLDRLDLDLGDLRGPDWQDQLLARLLERLEAALAGAAGSSSRAPARSPPRPMADAALQQFFFFLTHGRLPWWGRAPERGWTATLPTELGGDRWRSLGRLLERHPQARARLIEEMDDRFLSAAITAFAGFEGADRVLPLLAPAESDGESSRSWRRAAWELVLGHALAGDPQPPAGPELLRRLLQTRHRLARRAPPATAVPAAPGRADLGLGAGLGATQAGPARLPPPWREWLATAVDELHGHVHTEAGGLEEERAETAVVPTATANGTATDTTARRPGAAGPEAPLEPTAQPQAGTVARPAPGTATRADDGRPSETPSETPGTAAEGAAATGGTAPATPTAETAPQGPVPATAIEPPEPWRAGKAGGTAPGSVTSAPVGRRHEDSGEPRGGAAMSAGPAGARAPEAGSEPWLGPVPRQQVPEGEAIYVGGAGVVILHPFLEELFADRALLRERDFRDEEARRHAVQLLGFLTHGHDDAPEYELLLPKLLCGMPWEEPLPAAALDDTDREACDELLAAVLRHWQALKTASADWLREQFFLRDGKLEEVDGGWKLTVERRAQDVLLARLPWAVGLIRPPWRAEILHVSWTE